MAISAIDLFKAQPLDGVQQILSGGNNALVKAISDAVQIGRDTASLRATQEREYLSERDRVEALNQRKAEELIKNRQVDRAFGESQFLNDRNFDENVRQDTRDYKFKVRTDIRDASLRDKVAVAEILNRSEDNKRQKEILDIEKENIAEKKAFQTIRANEILAETKPTPVMGRIFRAHGIYDGNNVETLPEDAIAKGKELESIGIFQKDPALVKRGKQLISEGTQGTLARRAEIRATPLPPRPSTAKGTVEEKIAKLTFYVQAGQQFEADAKETLGEGLSDAKLFELRRAELELAALQKQLGSKGPTTGADADISDDGDDPLSKLYDPKDFSK